MNVRRQSCSSLRKSYSHRRVKPKMLLMAMIMPFALGSTNSGLDKCHSEIQGQIFSSLTECRPRPTLVDLRPYVANYSHVIQVIPDHLTLDTCGGSCYTPSHKCRPLVSTTRPVQVMMVLDKWPHGEHQTVCTTLQLEVHHQCQCGCHLKPDQCHPQLQYYHRPSCRCICSDFAARASCINDGKVWDPDTCSCQCPSHSWQLCSTGYMFDYVSTCSCVQISTVASKNLLATLCIILASISVVTVGGFFMFQYKRGPFKESIQTSSSIHSKNSMKRTLFMSQISKSEFDMMSLKSKLGTDDLLTIYEFDEKRNSLKSQDTVEETI